MIHHLAKNILANQPAANPYQPIIMMVLMVVMFYFLMIRPQQRQRKEFAKRFE
jgi:preprotein translocase subunit YajC